MWREHPVTPCRPDRKNMSRVYLLPRVVLTLILLSTSPHKLPGTTRRFPIVMTSERRCVLIVNIVWSAHRVRLLSTTVSNSFNLFVDSLKVATSNIHDICRGVSLYSLNSYCAGRRARLHRVHESTSIGWTRDSRFSQHTDVLLSRSNSRLTLCA